MTSDDWVQSDPLRSFLDTLELLVDLTGVAAYAIEMEMLGRVGDEKAPAVKRHRGVLLVPPDTTVGDIIQVVAATRKASLPNDGQPGFVRSSASLSRDGQPGFAGPSASHTVGPVTLVVSQGRASNDAFRRVHAWLATQVPRVNAMVRDQLAADALGEGVLLIGADGNVALCTDRAAAILGASADALESREVSTILPQVPRGLEPNEIARGALGAEHHHASFVMRHLAPALDGVEPPGFLLKLRDDRRFEAQRKRYLRFLSALRHDVRSPLTALKGLVSVLMDEPDMPQAERQSLLALLKQEAERTVTWVEDYLLVLRLRLESRPTQLLPMPAVSIAEALVRRFDVHARDRRISLVLAPPPPSSDMLVMVDPSLLEAFGNNLLGHVLRLGDAGADIEVSLEPAHDRPPALVIRAAGPGLFAAHPVEPFMTLARSTASGKRTPGVGLGLMLVKKVADVHGWKVSCEVDAGQGGLRVEVDWGANRAGVLPMDGA